MKPCETDYCPHLPAHKDWAECCKAHYEAVCKLEDALHATQKELAALKVASRMVLTWTEGGACSDCKMFRESPQQQSFLHHKECSHLEDINNLRALLGQDLIGFHEYDDPKAEMNRLYEERVKSWNLAQENKKQE